MAKKKAAPAKSKQQILRQKRLAALAKARQAKAAKRSAAKAPAKSQAQLKRQAMLQRLARGRATRASNLASRKAAAAELLASMTPAGQKQVQKQATQMRKQQAPAAPAAQAKSKAKRASKPKAQRKQSGLLGAKTPTGLRYEYRLVPGRQGADKFPYYLSPGFTSRVGGGAGGPGVIRAIPKSGAPPFASLDADRQREIVRFLNSEAGKGLRSPGAKRKIEYQKIRQVIKTVKKVA